MSDHAARFAELAALWNRIELRAKQAEQWRGEAILAAINEMRYAGRRIVDALDLMARNGDGSQNAMIDEHLVVAKNYLINADHDVTDAVLFIALRRVSKTIEQHGSQKVSQFCSGFKDDYQIVQKANELVQKSRQDRTLRIAAYRDLADNYLPRLMDLYQRLVAIQELALTEPINREIRSLRRKVIWTRRIVIVGAIASILALLLGVLFWIFPWSDFSAEFRSQVPPPSPPSVNQSLPAHP